MKTTFGRSSAADAMQVDSMHANQIAIMLSLKLFIVYLYEVAETHCPISLTSNTNTASKSLAQISICRLAFPLVHTFRLRCPNVFHFFCGLTPAGFRLVNEIFGYLILFCYTLKTRQQKLSLEQISNANQILALNDTRRYPQSISI